MASSLEDSSLGILDLDELETDEGDDETWLEKGTELQINGYKAHFNSIGPGKGLAVYIKDDMFKKTITINKEKMQIMKLESQDLEFLTVYRSEQGNSTELLQHLKDSINQNSATVISRDFNICYSSHRTNNITKVFL